MRHIWYLSLVVLSRLYLISGKQYPDQTQSNFRPKQLLLRDELLPWHDSWKSFMEDTESSTDIESSIRTALLSEQWWKKWEQLPSFTKDDVINKLIPVLVGGGDWKIHCSDAYRLCLADGNCRIKYWNYVTSCTDASDESMSIMSVLTSRSVIQPTLTKANDIHRTKRTARRDKPSRRRNKILHKPSWYRKKKIRRKRRKMAAARQKTLRPLHHWMGHRYRNIFHSFPPNPECNHKCVNSLLMLNNTVYGALLASCDCNTKLDGGNQNKTISVSAASIARINQQQNKDTCVRQQLKAKTCRPRVFRTTSRTIGCTEARLRCKNNPKCYKAQRNFLLKCSQVINGVLCTHACRRATKALKRVSKDFSKCRCDGSEGPVCQEIRNNWNIHCTKRKIKSRKASRKKLSKYFTSPSSSSKSLAELHTDNTSKRRKRPLQYKVLNRGI